MVMAVVAVVLVLGRSLVALGAKPVTWDVDAAQRKADYVWMRGVGAACMDSADAAVRILGHAAAINPGDVDLQAQLSVAKLSLGPAQEDSVIELLYEPLIESFRKNPSDYIMGQQTAAVAEHIGRFSDMIEIYSTLDSLYPSRTSPAVSLAKAYLYQYVITGDSADFNRGIDILNRLEKGTGPDLGLTSQKVRAYSIRKDYDAITRELNALTQARPTDPEAFLLTADIYGVLDMDSLVLPNIRKAVEVDPNNGRGLMKLAEYYRQAADSAAYDSTVFRVLRSPDVEFSSKFTIMRGYVSDMFADTAQWPRIDNLFAILQQVNPGESELHHLYASFEIARNNLAAASDQLAIGLALDPTDTDLRMLTMNTLLYRANNEKNPAEVKALQDSAIAVARGGMAMSPDILYFPIMAALTIDEQGDNEGAIRLMRSLKLDEVRNPKAVSAYMTTLGDLYQRSHQLDSAYAIYDRALALDPDNITAANNYAYFLSVENSQLDKAERLSRHAVGSEPDNPTYLDTYAWVLFKKGKFKDARKNINVALWQYVDSVEATEDSVEADTVPVVEGPEIMADSVAVDTAVVDNDEVVEEDELLMNLPIQLDDLMDFKDDLSSEILDHAGDIYYMTGDKEAARKFWKMAHLLAPDDADIARKARTGKLPEDKQPKAAPSDDSATKPSE